MDSIFLSSENSKKFHSHRLWREFPDQIDLRKGKKSVALSSLII